MGQKVRPTGIRIGITRDWSSRWYADKQTFGRYLLEDAAIRRHVKEHYYSAGIPHIEIERDANRVTVTLHAARPGVVIGRRGARVDQLKTDLEKITKQDVQLNIEEVRDPDTDAQLVAEGVAEQLRKRMAFRRVLKMTIKGCMERGVLGIKIMVSGRLGGAEMARKEHSSAGKIPLSTLRADIDYGFAEARTTFGIIGVKVWIYRGEVLPDKDSKKKKQIIKEEQPDGANAQAG